METIHDISINLVLLDESGERWRFDELLAHRGGVALQYGGLDAFSNALGGFELITSGHCIFYQSFDLADVESAVSFLLYGLASLGTLSPALAQRYGAYTSSLSLAELPHNTGAKLLLLRSPQKEDVLRLSFLPATGEQVMGRNSFFFEGIEVERAVWVAAVRVALGEYFEVLQLVREASEDGNEVDSRLEGILSEWFGG